MSEIKLLPCPFCGGEARLMCIDEEGEECCINDEDELEMGCSFVHCYNCDMDYIPKVENAKEVLESWNTRKPMQEIVKRLEKKIDNKLYNPNWNAGIIAAISVVESAGGMNE